MASHPAYAAFRHKPYRLYSAGRLLTISGAQMTAAAVAWQVYERTGRALDLGWVGLVQLAPALALAPWAGILADRCDRLKILRWGVALTAACSVALAVISVRTDKAVWPIYLALAGIGVARGLLAPAVQAALASLVPPSDFPSAVAWRSTLFELATITGPAAGGFLLHGLGAAGVYWTDAILQTLGLTLFWRIRPLAVQPAASPEASLGKDGWLEGARHIWRKKELLGALTLDLAAVLFGGAYAILPIFAKDILRATAWQYGWLRAAPSIGAVAMALALIHGDPIRRSGRALLASVAAFGGAWLLFGLSTSFWLSFACLVAAGSADNVSVIIRHTIVQTRTPDRLRGRVSAVNGVFIQSSNQLGAFESGLAAQFLGAAPSVVAGAAVTLLAVAGAAWRWPDLRKLGPLHAPLD